MNDILTLNNPVLNHIICIIINLSLYVLLALSLYGIGRFTLKYFERRLKIMPNTTLTIWLGFCISLLVFQIIHLFLPLTYHYVIPFYISGIIVSIYSICKSHVKLALPSKLIQKILVILFILVSVIISAWVASRAMLPPDHYDTGLYHYAKILWINSYPVVKGLGNLHGRLAFNNSFFLFVGSLNFSPLFNNGEHIANSFLYLLTLATIIEFILPALRDHKLLFTTHAFTFFPSILILPVFLKVITNSTLSSPDADLAVFLFQIILFLFFAKIIASKEKHIASFVLCTIFAITLSTIKLGSVFFSWSIIITLSIIYLYSSTISLRRLLTRLVLLSLIIYLPWSITSYLQSGVPAYPSTIGYIDFDWSIPKTSISNMAMTISNFAKLPGYNNIELFKGFNWVGIWWQNLANSSGFGYFILPVALGIIFTIVSLVIPLVSSSRTLRIEFASIIPLLFSIICWFFTAPDPRLAGSIFELIPVISVCILFQILLANRINTRIFELLFIGGFLLINVLYFTRIVKPDRISFSGYAPKVTANLVQEQTSSGLTIFIPTKGDQCWYAPVLSAPSINPKLKLRVNNQIESGFTVK